MAHTSIAIIIIIITVLFDECAFRACHTPTSLLVRDLTDDFYHTDTDELDNCDKPVDDPDQCSSCGEGYVVTPDLKCGCK